ncbi:hypothetical protein BDQ17DRAFT_979548 [Cyathus striatus]|nr:hypothetical protein BDQ17DRAFT_979548 [Cyathus striatus]
MLCSMQCNTSREATDTRLPDASRAQTLPDPPLHDLGASTLATSSRLVHAQALIYDKDIRIPSVQQHAQSWLEHFNQAQVYSWSLQIIHPPLPLLSTNHHPRLQMKLTKCSFERILVPMGETYHKLWRSHTPEVEKAMTCQSANESGDTSAVLEMLSF